MPSRDLQGCGCKTVCPGSIPGRPPRLSRNAGGSPQRYVNRSPFHGASPAMSVPEVSWHCRTIVGLFGIRKGTTRVVLACGVVALKFAIGTRGRRCNRFEVEMFARVNERRRAMLCTALWCNSAGSLLVARAARPLTQSECDYLMATDGFPDWDYMPPDETEPFEYKASDWGWLNGRLVALDYAAPALWEIEIRISSKSASELQCPMWLVENSHGFLPTLSISHSEGYIPRRGVPKECRA